MAQYTSTAVGAEDIVSYFISLLIFIIVIIIISIVFVCKCMKLTMLMYISVNYRLSFFYFYFRSSIKQFADNCGQEEQGLPSSQQTDPPRFLFISCILFRVYKYGFSPNKMA